MIISAEKLIDKTTLTVVKESFEEQKNICVLSIYEHDNDIYGIYLNNPYDSLSFIKAPLYSMSTDIDGHNIFMMELGTILHFIYQNGSLQMFNWLMHPSSIDCSNDLFLDLLNICFSNPPLLLSSFHLIRWIDKMNKGDLKMSTINLLDMVKEFDKVDPLDVDVSDVKSEVLMKNKLNEVRQELKGKNYKKITEATINKIDKLFIQMQLDLYMTDDK